jgi:hypothetical protein
VTITASTRSAGLHFPIEAFALAAQRRLNAAPKVEEQMTLENRTLIPQK